MRFVSVLLCLLLVTKAFGGAADTVSGTASYRERMALPPEAVFEATLEDVSKADAPVEVIGQVRIEAPGNPSIRFTIPMIAGASRQTIPMWCAAVSCVENS